MIGRNSIEIDSFQPPVFPILMEGTLDAVDASAESSDKLTPTNIQQFLDNQPDMINDSDLLFFKDYFHSEFTYDELVALNQKWVNHFDIDSSFRSIFRNGSYNIETAFNRANENYDFDDTVRSLNDVPHYQVTIDEDDFFI